VILQHHSELSRDRRRAGVTLTEVLVVIVIIGILVALILPAVLGARAAARRMHCANNLRQLAQAVMQFEAAHQRLPNSGTYGVHAPGGGPPEIDWFQPKRSWVVDLLPFIDQKNIHDNWTFVDPNPADSLFLDHPNWNVASPATWATDTADGIVGVAINWADIDPQNRDNAALSHKHIAVLVCPGDPTAVDQPGALSYVCNSGYGEFDGTLEDTNYNNNWSVTQIDWNGDRVTCAVTPFNDPQDAQIARRTGLFWAGSPGMKTREDVRVAFASIIDGTSSTIMFTENINAGFAPRGDPSGTQGDFTWAFPWTLATGFSISTRDICPNGQFGVCNRPEQDLVYESANAAAAIGRINGFVASNKGRAPFPCAHHGSVINIAFCDGSARGISANIDGFVYCKLVSPQGGNLPMGSQIHAGRTDEGLHQGPLSGESF